VKEAAGSLKTLIHFYQITGHPIPGDINLHTVNEIKMAVHLSIRYMQEDKMPFCSDTAKALAKSIFCILKDIYSKV
jgi:hypothetical protein